MSDDARTLIERARALSPADRIALVEDVLDSLDRADPDIDKLWAREATDRMAACRRGELAARDWLPLPLPACGERVGARGCIEWRTAILRNLNRPLTPTLSPHAGRGRNTPSA